MQPVDDGFEADLIDEAHHEAVMEALGENIDLHAEVKTLRARVAELEAERDRYREALEYIAHLDDVNQDPRKLKDGPWAARKAIALIK